MDIDNGFKVKVNGFEIDYSDISEDYKHFKAKTSAYGFIGSIAIETNVYEYGFVTQYNRVGGDISYASSSSGDSKSILDIVSIHDRIYNDVYMGCSDESTVTDFIIDSENYLLEVDKIDVENELFSLASTNKLSGDKVVTQVSLHGWAGSTSTLIIAKTQEIENNIITEEVELSFEEVLLKHKQIHADIEEENNKLNDARRLGIEEPLITMGAWSSLVEITENERVISHDDKKLYSDGISFDMSVDEYVNATPVLQSKNKLNEIYITSLKKPKDDVQNYCIVLDNKGERCAKLLDSIELPVHLYNTKGVHNELYHIISNEYAPQGYHNNKEINIDKDSLIARLIDKKEAQSNYVDKLLQRTSRNFNELQSEMLINNNYSQLKNTLIDALLDDFKILKNKI